MFKKHSFLIILVVFLVLNILKVPILYCQNDLAPNANSAILMEAVTGKILFSKNSNARLFPASMTKIMTMLLVMEAIDAGKISLKDYVVASKRAASIGGSQIFLKEGEKMTVEDLLKGVAISSGNDASVALAEYLAGSEESFVSKMNAKVKYLKLKNTHFVNSNGLPSKNHYSSAYDMAILARELLKYPQITAYTGKYEDYLRKNTKKPFWLVNTNKLVKFYEGLDGLKTGFTKDAKYCLTATAKRGNMRLIAVVMGEPDVKTRNKEVCDLLDYAFENYVNNIVYNKGDLIAKKIIEKGIPEVVEIRAKQPIGYLLRKDEKDSLKVVKKIEWKKLELPITKGQVIGKMVFEKEGSKILTIDLVSSKDIKMADFWSIFKDTLKEFLLFTS